MNTKMEEIVIASSSIDGGIGCWDLQTGTEHLRYKSCASPTHGLISVGRRFLASSQLQDPKASSGAILYWSWSRVSYFINIHTNCLIKLF
jgi:pre-rRNA-processing protein IPI3